MDIERFKKKPIMGIVRGLKQSQLAPLMDTVIQAGLETLEITMNTAGAEELISQAAKLAGDKLMIGAGTVMNVSVLQSALDAGASYIVLPIMEPDVVAYCVEKNIPVFPGALTPQEIYYAWQAGATMVKVFPSRFFGAEYFKEIKGPFNKVKLLACGGVSAGNVAAFLDNGADAFAFGGSVFKQSWLDNNEYDNIGMLVKQLINAYEEFKNKV